MFSVATIEVPASWRTLAALKRPKAWSMDLGISIENQEMYVVLESKPWAWQRYDAVYIYIYIQSYEYITYTYHHV